MRSLGAQTADGRWQTADVRRHMADGKLWLASLVYFMTNTYQLASLVELKKTRVTLLVEFGTNTLVSLVYFAILVVANHMRSLGAHSADSNEQEN